MNDSKLVSIIANNAIKEANRIRNFFAHGELSIEQANQSLLSLRDMLWGVADDLRPNNIADDEIRNAIRVVREYRDIVCDYKARLEFRESELRKELRLQIHAEYQEA